MQLLISVTVPAEVPAAIQGGADIIDIKNPAEGALGASTPRIIRQVRQATPPSIPVSATVGDLPDLPGTAALAALGATLCGVQYVKVGLLGTQQVRQAVALLAQVCQAVKDANPETQVIAAAYADAHHIGALPPLALPEAAAAAGVDGCLVDTFRKGQGHLFDYLDDAQLARFLSDCRRHGLLCALAGSLQIEHLDHISRLAPDVVGFRTAACRGGDRTHGRVDADQVHRLKARLA